MSLWIWCICRQTYMQDCVWDRQVLVWTKYYHEELMLIYVNRIHERRSIRSNDRTINKLVLDIWISKIKWFLTCFDKWVCERSTLVWPKFIANIMLIVQLSCFAKKLIFVLVKSGFLHFISLVVSYFCERHKKCSYYHFIEQFY